MILLVVVVRARRRAVVRWRSWPTISEREQVRILRKTRVAMSRDEEKMLRTLGLWLRDLAKEGR
jgi:hypothetical protein